MELNQLIKEEVLSDGQENITDSSNIERFHKRLEIYRTHSNDCKERVDQTLNHIHEQQSNEISLLQNKSKEQKKKRTNRKGLTKQSEHNQILMKNQQRLCQSSEQLTPTPENLTQCSSVRYFHKFEYLHQHPSEQVQSIQAPFVNNVQIKQENEQPFYSPENEFDDLDFNGMAKLMNQPVGPELLKIDEDFHHQQVPLLSLHQYAQTDDQKRYKNIYFNPNYFP